MEPGVGIAQQIAELRGLSVPALVARYEALYGKPPRIKNKEWLWKRCAWQLQEQAFGGLSGAAKARLEELISEIKLPEEEKRRSVAGKLAPSRAARSEGLKVGTTLVRQWHGRQVSLTVVDGGYELDGVLHKSLSAAAAALTGSHWNGRLFWGLTARKRSR